MGAQARFLFPSEHGMRIRLSAESVHGDFVKQIEDISGQDLLACNQCGKCSSGCPVAFALDLLPIRSFG